MEKTKNGYFNASFILEMVFASIYAFYLIISMSALLSETFIYELYNQLLLEGLVEELDAVGLELMFDTVRTVIIVMLIVGFASIAMMYITGAFLKKYSNLTDAEADKYFGKALAWVIISYFFGGLLIGGLATGGLCAVTNKQKQRVNVQTTQSSANANNFNTNQVSNKDYGTENVNSEKLSVEELEKMQQRLQKIKDLKDSGAITEEEYEEMRKSIIDVMK